MSTTPTRRCLVADDDDNIRELLAINLEIEGFEVHTASDGDQALAIAAAIAPDLVVLDVMMPGRDGFEVVKAMKTDERLRDVPVVLLTAKATDAEIWEGWSSGADYYVTKPFDIDTITNFVHMVFDGTAVAG